MHADGIVRYTTPSHGGIKLSRKRNDAVHAAWRNASGWYEEDCEWSIVVLTHPGAFDAKTIAEAGATARDYYPDAYEAATGRPVSLDESRVLRERRDRALYEDRWIGVCAWGDWYKGGSERVNGAYTALGPVPAGHVGIIARRGARPGAEERAFLVLAESHRDSARRTEIGYVVPEFAEEWTVHS